MNFQVASSKSSSKLILGNGKMLVDGYWMDSEKLSCETQIAMQFLISLDASYHSTSCVADSGGGVLPDSDPRLQT